MNTSQEKSTAIATDVRGVANRITCSTRHVANLVEAGEFPPGFKLGRLRRWYVADVEAWIAERAKNGN